MATNIRLKSSSVSNKVPTLSDLSLRELAVNTTDGRLFLRKGNGTVSDVIVDVTDHGSFYGLADDDHTQYLHSTITRTGVTAELNTTGKITTTNSIGIGTTNPVQKLTITNAAKSSADGSLFALSSSDATNAFQLLISRTAAGAGSSYAIQSVEQNVDFRNLSLNPNGGNVGIGTTNPESKTHIAVEGVGVITALTLDNIGGAAVGADFKVNYGGYATSRIVFDFVGGQFGSGSHGMNYISGRTNFSNHWFRNASNATQMVMNNAGNLLIGTETDSGTASQRLQVTGGAYISGKLGIGTTTVASGEQVQVVGGGLRAQSLNAVGTPGAFAATGGIIAYHNGSGVGILRAYSDAGGGSGTLILNASGSEDARINSSGNVGIGTTDPITKLDVRGNQKIERNVNGEGGSLFLRNTSTGTGAYSVIRFSESQDVGLGGNAYIHYFNSNWTSNGYWDPKSLASGTADGNINFWVGGNNIFKIWTNNTPRLYVLGNGNVGIGITTPATRLHVLSSISSLPSADDTTTAVGYFGNTYINTTNGTSAYTVLRLQRSGEAGITYPSTADFSIARYEASGTASRTRLDIRLGHQATNTTDTTVMSLLSSGNVGIGTTNPVGRLHSVAATTLAALTLSTPDIGSARLAHLVGGNNYSYGVVGIVSGDGTQFGDAYGLGSSSNPNGSWSPTLTWTTQSGQNVPGRVGIGITTPQYSLHLGGEVAGSATGQIALGSIANVPSARIDGYRVDGTYRGELHLYTTNNGGTQNRAVTIDSVQNVGIGTTNPQGKLHLQSGVLIVNNGTPGIVSPCLQLFSDVVNNLAGSGQRIEFRSDTLNGYIEGVRDAAPGPTVSLRLGTAFGEVIRIIGGTSNVGIGTTDPAARLHVSGNVRIADASTASLFISRSSNTVTAQHFYTPSTDSPWYLYGENLTWTGERIGTTRRAERAYYEAFAPAVGRKEFGFVNKASADTAFISTDLIPSLVLKNNGTVGIGTTDPTELLSLYSSAGTTFGVSLTPIGWNSARHRFTVPTSGNSSMLSWNYNGSVVDSSLYATSAVFVQNGIISLATGTFNTVPVDRLVVNSTGNVGIGTTNPADKLDVNGNVLPTTDATHNLGSPSKRWNNVYTTDLQLSNEGSQNDVDGTWGQYTIQEGEEDLFLINRRNGKKYKFVLQEVG